MGKYNESHYRIVLKHYQFSFNIRNSDHTPGQWMGARMAIMRMFDDSLTIKEILAAFDEACEKKKWPGDVKFWKRVHDVALKNRREARPTMEVDKGFEDISSVLSTKFKMP